MIYTARTSSFHEMKLALFGAVFLAFPIIATQVYRVRRSRPLQERARRVPPLSLLWTFLLFILGAAVVYFVVMPLAMKFFCRWSRRAARSKSTCRHASANTCR